MAKGHKFNRHERHPTNSTDTWLTPECVIDALGPFDLDPCAAPEPRPWPTAARMISLPDDGLAIDWEGLVWLNPPYSNAAAWLKRLADHGTGCGMMFARTDTKMFHNSVWPKHSGMLFLRGRVSFCGTDGRRVGRKGRSGAPSVLIGYGDEMLRRLANCGLDGALVVSSAAVVLGSDGRAVGTWREVVNRVVAGETMTLRAIYAKAEATDKVRYSKARGWDWKAVIRRTVQECLQPVSRGVWAPAV